MNKFDISVVIGFRNWGTERLRMAGQSIVDSFAPYRGELIISDYGSVDSDSVKEVAEYLGAKYVYTPGDPVWSRSRAINAGFAVAEGEILVATDADMIFSPAVYSTIVERIQQKKNTALFLQIRDLPEHMSSEELAALESIEWRELEVACRLRPRWGMGALTAVHRDAVQAIRGFDERMHTYGAEDLDFAVRARYAGYRTVWMDDPKVRMYHMWHPVSRKVAEKTSAGQEALDFNTKIFYEDRTVVRNVTQWRHPLKDAQPLVTVSIVTYNRAEYIGETIKSILIQTVQDFEILIIDDGSTDNTRQVVESFDDSRIRYVYQENAGISVARNHAVQLARGQYIAVQDDDDLIPPRRLEWQLESLTEGVSGSVGSFIYFDQITGKTENYVAEIPSVNQIVESGGTPGHGTWLMPTAIFKAFPYDETLTGSSQLRV